jgi:hypothetical protein
VVGDKGDEDGDDFERILDPDFVNSAPIKEADWRARQQAFQKRKRRQARQAGWARRRESLTSRRAAVAMVLVAALVLLAFSGVGHRFLYGPDDDKPARTTTTTERPATTTTGPAVSTP